MRQPRLVFRQLRRALLTKILNACKSIRSMDQKSSATASNNGFEPDVFIKNQTIDNALTKIEERAQELKALKR